MIIDASCTQLRSAGCECPCARRERAKRFEEAMRRRRILSAALWLSAAPAGIASLYAMGDSGLGPWWGVAGFVLATAMIVLGHLTEAPEAKPGRAA